MSRFFDGVDDIIACGSTESLDDLDLQGGGGLTWCGWILPYSLGEGSQGHIVSKGTGVTAGRFNFMLINATPSIRFTKFYDGGVELTTTSANSSITLGVWQFVAVTWDGTATSATGVKFYVNGLLIAHGGDANGVGNRVSDAALNLQIGNRGNTDRTFNGNISHLHAYNRILSITEIRMLMMFPGSITNGLKGYWPLHGTSTPEPDLSGNKNDGTVTGATLANGPQIGRHSRLRRIPFSYKVPPATGSQAYAVNLTLAMALTDTLSKDTLKVIVEALSLTEAKSLDTLKQFTESLTLSHPIFSPSKDILKVIAQSLTVTESRAFDIMKALSDSITVSEASAKDFLKVVSQSMTLTESQSKDLIKHLSESISLTEAQSKNVLKVLIDSLTLTDSLNTSLVGIILALYTNLLRGNIDAHDKLAMLKDLISTGVLKGDIDWSENTLVATGIQKIDDDQMTKDSDQISWDFHND